MPAKPTSPVTYIGEAPSGARTIPGVATSITAFVGAAARGPLTTPVTILSWSEYARAFGGLSRAAPLSYAVSHFFANGGSTAIVARVANGARTATAKAGSGAPLALAAASSGAWSSSLRARVTAAPPQHNEGVGEPLFNLLLRDTGSGRNETFPSLSPTRSHPRYVGTILAIDSELARLDGDAPAALPGPSGGGDADLTDPAAWAPFTGGDDGAALDAAAVAAGLASLGGVDLINLLVVPPFAFGPSGDRVDVDAATRAAAAKLADEKRAIYVADAPLAWIDPAKAATADLAALGLGQDPNVALYFPGLKLPDPLQRNQAREFAPAGAIAGVIARTDAAGGVWKAPAGVRATLTGVIAPAVRVSDPQQAPIVARGINPVRSFPPAGPVIWGARTLAGADALGSQWKYLAVRRLVLFIEQSLARGMQWAVFEPNDEPLWAQIRLAGGAFLQDLFRRGAFQGATPHDAYWLRCGSDTTTQADLSAGIVEIEVGFAPIKPAEFVVLRLWQLTSGAT